MKGTTLKNRFFSGSFEDTSLLSRVMCTVYNSLVLKFVKLHYIIGSSDQWRVLFFLDFLWFSKYWIKHFLVELKNVPVQDCKPLLGLIHCKWFIYLDVHISQGAYIYKSSFIIKGAKNKNQTVLIKYIRRWTLINQTVNIVSPGACELT